MSLQGIMVALYTPSTADQSAIDVAALDQHIQYLIKVSVHGLVPGGSTGEFTALTLEERKQLVEVCVESAAGRVPVIAGTGALSTRGGVALNCFPVKVYGEAEFWFASLKVFGLIALLITALVIACGGAPDGEALGFRYWNQPGPVKEYLVGGASGRLCAFIGTLVFSVFAFAFAPELIVATGGEMQWLRRNLPSAGRRYIYRLVFLYILGSFFIGLIASSDNARLLGGGKGAGSSPWAIAISEAGMSVYPDIVNAIILTSAWSAGNSYLYLSSRALYGLALVGTAPKIFARAGSQSASSTCGSARAQRCKGITDLPYPSRFQPCFAWVCGVTFFVLMLLNGFKVFVGDNWDVSSFLTAYIGIPILLALYFGHRFTVARDEPWYIDAKPWT